jgi:hypothetical protein
LAINDRPDAASGENPRPIRIAPVTATGVPKPDAQELQASVGRDAADGGLQDFESAVRHRQSVEEDDVEHDPADGEEARHRAERRRPQRHVGRHGEDEDRDEVGDDQRDDRGVVRLDLVGCDQRQQCHDGQGRRDRRQRGVAERIIDLIPHHAPPAPGLLTCP